MKIIYLIASRNSKTGYSFRQFCPNEYGLAGTSRPSFTTISHELGYHVKLKIGQERLICVAWDGEDGSVLSVGVSIAREKYSVLDIDLVLLMRIAIARYQHYNKISERRVKKHGMS